MTWAAVEDLLLRCRLLLCYLSPREDLCARALLVSKLWCESALARLREIPCQARCLPTPESDSIPLRLAEDFLDDFVHLRRMLRPGLLAAMPPPSERDPQAWTQPYVQLPDWYVHAPHDVMRGEDVVHIRHSDVEIRGTGTYFSRTITAHQMLCFPEDPDHPRITFLMGRIRVAKGVRNVKVSDICIVG